MKPPLLTPEIADKIVGLIDGGTSLAAAAEPRGVLPAVIQRLKSFTADTTRTGGQPLGRPGGRWGGQRSRDRPRQAHELKPREPFD